MVNYSFRFSPKKLDITMPHSMTAFARETIQAEFGSLSCEIRSVNHRYLEPHLRLPEPLRAAEPMVREQLRKNLQRGKVEVAFQLASNSAEQSALSLNEALMHRVVDALDQVTQVSNQLKPTLDPMSVLQWPGVVEQKSIDNEALQAHAQTLLGQTLNSLLEHRQREGAELQRLIEARLADIAEQVVIVRENMPEILQLQRDKLRTRLEELAAEFDDGRLEQEMAILANKADVAEELDRLETHLNEVAHIFKQKGAIGRRLDFMMQELNREANTLSSKSLSSQTTQAAVNIKVLIEQMREQIQNIE